VVKARGDKAKIRGIDFLKNRSPIKRWTANSPVNATRGLLLKNK
jgi:hypothetical protein